MSVTQRHSSTPRRSLPHPRLPSALNPRSKMPSCTPRGTLLVTFLVAYMIITFYIAKLQHSCSSSEDLLVNVRDTGLLNDLRNNKIGGGAFGGQNLLGLNASRLAQVVRSGLKAVHVKNAGQDNIMAPEGQALPFGDGGKVGVPPAKPKPTAFRIEGYEPNEVLSPDYSPSTVYYVWCGRRWFEYQNYLSVMSVIRELTPDNIVFYYDTYPVLDSWTYNTWFDELRNDYPFFRIHKLDIVKENACLGHAKINPHFVFSLLTDRGGMFVNEYTLLEKFPMEYRNYSIVHGLDVNTMEGLLMTKRGYPGSHAHGLDEFVRLNDPRVTVKSLQCSDPTQYVKAIRKPDCVLAKQAFFPKDIWDLDTSFGRLARRIFYGDPEIHLPPQNYDELIPNIAHVVWIGGGEMDFLFYLGMLSLIYVAEVDMVYLHGNGPPTGHFWHRIKDNPKLRLIYREVPGTVYGNKVDVLSHVTDVWRVDFMVKYGGIYVDTDTAFVKKLDRDIRAYDAVGSYDWTYWNHPFPDTINFGVAIGKRNAIYWQEFQKSMKWFMDADWSWNGLRQPYRIKERHPEMVRIDPRLQVICYESKCHPTWYPDYHDERVHHLNSNPITDWRNDVYAFHWTLPTPVELLSEENLIRNNTMFSEIGKFILEKAGVLEEIKRRVNRKA